MRRRGDSEDGVVTKPPQGIAKRVIGGLNQLTPFRRDITSVGLRDQLCIGVIYF
jgi:hypothetical protein